MLTRISRRLSTFRASLLVVCAFCNIQNAMAEAGNVFLRELAMPGLGWTGHLAIQTNELVSSEYSQRSIMLEVLNEGLVIVKNSIDNFYGRSKFRFAKYYATCPGCSHNYPSVIAAGWEQSKWSPSYTYSSTYTEGKNVRMTVWDPAKRAYVRKVIRQNARFRCDSFVVYSFIKGIGRNFSSSPFYPTGVIARFPYYVDLYGV